ncbi:chromodomain-helicase-DNA-binding protein 1-like [Sinocyclocheilus grahami]|uniref:chromodomain-helicase-DNA-binding protein 1-like n=1 Tax=Sinocyclocheilus grahami TaxID=75366 RepID=UPI0007AD5B9C|nr:PREDICTED: chromodomain-helicase-DNA-binding protein 1-like [Sinocyclocheilus grahami]
MSKFLRAIKSNIPEKDKSELTESDLKKWGLEAIHLRSYQVDGVRWLSQCMKNQQGCILGDEMGLGKTCQTISLLAYARGCLKMNGPFLVLCPLSVLENWRQELERFCPILSVIYYTGDKEKRAELQKELRNNQHFHVLLTTYEMCLKDARYLKSWKWKILVVDEAHRLKNQESLLHQTLKEFTVGFRVLLTGTPIQNNLQEVYSLLTFIQPSLFLPDAVEDFVSAYSDVQTEPALDVFVSVCRGHRVLLFSQMTRMLDILQDYLEYRGYSYERLDGSVRGEERNLAIKNFSSKDVFIFLLSTKAGGVGMNLTAADTVIFVDSDFNPQNDLQAAARAHRIGQTRPVKVIRLLGRDTVEEIIYSRAVSKLRLTDTVIEEGRFSLLDQAQSAASGLQLSEILKFGVDKLLSSEESSIQDVDLRLILGQSRDGRWLLDEEHVKLNESDEEEDEDMEGQNHMYYFEGKDYSKDPSAEDEKTFELLLEKQLADLEDAGKEGRALRNKAGMSLSGPLIDPGRKKRPLTVSELEQRRQKRQEAAAKRAKLQEERKKQQEELNYKKKMAWWESCGYKSLCLPRVDSEGEDIEPDEDDDDVSWSSTDSDHTAIRYVLGDVTHPQADREDAIIVHCVDDSGHWGRGGLFTTLELRSDEPKKQYELAGDMEDLELGNVLLFPIDDKQSRLSGRDYLTLIVAQQRDTANNLSGIRLTALDEGLKKIYRDAKQKKASVHLPRIGHSTKGFNWYGTERLIRKHLATKGISTFIYYYKRATSHSSTVSSTTCTSTPSTSHSASDPAASLPSGSPHSSSALGHSEDLTKSPKPSTISHEGQDAPGLADFMRGVHVYFYNMAATEKKKLARYLITYDGDEEDLMSSHVTHIVGEVQSPVHAQELRDLLHQYPQTLLVKKKWLESCFANQRKVSVSKYVIRLT